MAEGTQTYVRDAVVQLFADQQKQGAVNWLTGDEVARRLQHNEEVLTQVLLNLFRKQILQRRMRGGTNRFEYYAGHKFPYHRDAKRSEKLTDTTIPAASGMAGTVLKINGRAEAVTLKEAKALFNDLKVLFG